MSEETTTTETAAEAVEFGAERVESSRAIVEAERVMPTDFAHNAAIHYAKALRKPPRFADALFSMWEYNPNRENVLDEIDIDFAEAREDLRVDERHKAVVAGSIISVKTLGAFIEYLRGDKAACVEELYDAVAVLMRMIAVVEGKQQLGKEN